ncbi:hypothetical protein M3J09_000134 [Ascochyta lentis]
MVIMIIIIVKYVPSTYSINPR